MGIGTFVASTFQMAQNIVTNSRLAQMATKTIKGNNTGGTANAADLTATQVTAMLNPFTTSLQGVVTGSGGGTSNFLRADGSWAAPSGGGSVPSGTILPFGGSSAPAGFLLCDGTAVSRTTFANLFTAVGTAFGSGDGSTTFNVPDLRYNFLRGFGPNTITTGSGSASSNNGTFTAHGFTRTGLQVRMASGTLSGLAVSTDYFVIVVDANTLAFATSFANAIAGTKIAITGSNSAVIVQNEDLGSPSRIALMSGGNSGANIGSYEFDAFQGHVHNPPNGSGGGQGFTVHAPSGLGNGLAGGGDTSNAFLSTGSPATDSTSGTPRTGVETRPKNIYVNYIIAE